ncbi:MAG: hypothetical protein HGA85_05110 [Nanoarchaeota archaeon]|nr:hypothetical protein [Nanoarchaeota archaeon]
MQTFSTLLESVQFLLEIKELENASVLAMGLEVIAETVHEKKLAYSLCGQVNYQLGAEYLENTMIYARDALKFGIDRTEFGLFSRLSWKDSHILRQAATGEYQAPYLQLKWHMQRIDEEACEAEDCFSAAESMLEKAMEYGIDDMLRQNNLQVHADHARLLFYQGDLDGAIEKNRIAERMIDDASDSEPIEGYQRCLVENVLLLGGRIRQLRYEKSAVSYFDEARIYAQRFGFSDLEKEAEAYAERYFQDRAALLGQKYPQGNSRPAIF